MSFAQAGGQPFPVLGGTPGSLIKPVPCWVKPGAAHLDQIKFDLILSSSFFGKSFGTSFIKTQTWLHAVIAQLDNNKSYKQVCCSHAWSNDLRSFTQNSRAIVCFYSYVFGSHCNKLRKCGVPLWCLFQWEKTAHTTHQRTGLPFSWGAEVCAALLASAGGSRRYMNPQGKAAAWFSLYRSVTINFMSVYSLSWYFSCLVDDQWVVNLES